jgi:distribution and morphology protein 31
MKGRHPHLPLHEQHCKNLWLFLKNSSGRGLQTTFWLCFHLFLWATHFFFSLAQPRFYQWLSMSSTVYSFKVSTARRVHILLPVKGIDCLSSLFLEYLASKLGEHLTHETGIKVTFESAIVPRWKDGTIRLKNVRIQRNKQSHAQMLKRLRENGSDDTHQDSVSRKAAENSNHGLGVSVAHSQGLTSNDPRKSPEATTLGTDENEQDDFTYFDFNARNVDVTLDLMKFLNGKGLVKDCYIKGVRGTVDRRHVDFSRVNPLSWLQCRQAQPGDFEIQNFSIEDCHVNVFDANNFRPYAVSIFNSDLSRFRLQWLLYDMLCADSITGELDGCLFSLTKPHQVKSKQHVHEVEVDNSATADSVQRISRLKLSGVNVDMLNYGATGPFKWITGGTVDIDAYLVIPEPSQRDEDDQSYLVEGDLLEKLSQEIDEIRSRLMDELQPVKEKLLIELREKQDILQAVLSNYKQLRLVALLKEEMEKERSQRKQASDASTSAQDSSDFEKAAPVVNSADGPQDSDSTTTMQLLTNTIPNLTMYIDLHFNNLRTSVPASSTDLSYLNSTLIRPIVAFMNAQPRSTIPISIRVKVPLHQFDGAWTIYQCRMIDYISSAIGIAFADLVRFEYSQYIRTGTSGNRPSGEGGEGGDGDGSNSEKERRGLRLVWKLGWWGIQSASRGIVGMWEWVNQSSVHGYETGAGGASVATGNENGYDDVYSEFVWSAA